MLSKSFIAAALALAVSAQTSTDCNCPADAAVGKKGINCDFTKGACDAFDHIAGKAVTYGPRGAVSAVDGSFQAPTLVSKAALFFGRVDVEMQAAPGRGIVTSLVLLSDDLDEIDLEALGFDNANIQSNTFSRGDKDKHDLLGLLPVADLTGASHRYTVDWTTERIEFYVDGALKRTLKRADIPDRYPESPMRVRFGAWVAGGDGNQPGTIDWAGGRPDFSKGPAASYFKSVTVVDYAGGSSATDKDVKEYSYGDRTGSSKSIRVHLADGSTPSGDSPSATTKSSSSESSVTGTTSAKKAASTTESTSTTSEHASNSTITTKTATSSTAKHTPTGSSPATTPSLGAAVGLSIGAGVAAVAAFLAL
ncbi:Concanavalin A-like lectin/glucanase [Cordyceps militaris CM01]|uniref:Concanavalin A-like lectin/glucanase n=1 Tax=Cordyceps militaris (strain CM01) TaxID=983644 RepID=G3JFZ9_CORMM|nr:Concanavalin A-like lectin/glucanase [Cordyceps militaris CM01]EGX93617.1 Concanavalin A-like lectin/glucanase [Cordyceps militaris CM01]